jgi:protein downstream neighbor of Son
LNEKKDNIIGSEASAEEGEDDTDADEDSDEPDEWLEQIGLNSTVNFKASSSVNTLERSMHSKAQNSTSITSYDNLSRSTMLFDQAGDVQALFNYLLNCKKCILNSGSLAGVPATLLAPMPFIGATLQKIKVEQNIIKTLSSTGQSITQFALDFKGPIMPYHAHRLLSLFGYTQKEFEMTSNVYEQSGSLNCMRKQHAANIESAGDGGDDSNKDVTASKYLDASELNSIKKEYGTVVIY